MTTALGGVSRIETRSCCTSQHVCRIVQIACGILLLLGTFFATWAFSGHLRYYTVVAIASGVALSMPLILCHPAEKEEIEARSINGPKLVLKGVREKVVEAAKHLFDRDTDPSIERGPKVPHVSYYNSSYLHRVFEVASKPGYIFKVSLVHGDISDRLKKIERARAIVHENNLNLLVIPKAWISKVTVPVGMLRTQEIEVLIEEKCEMEKSLIQQEKNFVEGDGFSETIYQLAIFAIKADWDDFSLNNASSMKKNPKIAVLPDLESCFAKNGAVIGICGGEAAEETVKRVSSRDGEEVIYRQNARAGLVGCIGEKYFEDVRRAIVDSGREDILEPFERACQKRSELLRLEKELPAFYSRQGIYSPAQTLTHPKDTGLSRDEQFVAKWAIESANKTFARHAKTHPELPAKYIRHFTLIYGTEVEDKVVATKQVLKKVVKALIAKGVFHHVSFSGKYQLRIQA